MKHIYRLLASLGVFMLVLGVNSCTSDNDVEPLFDQSINERTEALKSEYSNILITPEHGWVGYYSPNNSFGFYTVLLDFDSNGDVVISSDYALGSGDNKITYRIDKTLKLELVFETRSVLSDIFAINNNNNDGEFVFNILSATQNEIVLESKLDFGDDITIFNLRRARPEELNLNPVFKSVENVFGDDAEALFSDILFKDDVIGQFSFDPVTRFAAISYTSTDDTIIVMSVPIIITPTGFVFVDPLDINGVRLTNFQFNETRSEYENPADALRIIYNKIPYDFGTSDESAVFNSDEPFKHSGFFNAFYNDFSREIARNVDWEGLRIDNIIIWELNTQEIPYIELRTNYGRVSYNIDFNFDEDTRIVKFNLTGDTDAPEEFTAVIQPLLDILIGSSEGYYVMGSGTGITFANTTFTLINIDNPNYKIDYWTSNQ